MVLSLFEGFHSNSGRVKIPETWGPKHSLMDLTFGYHAGPKLEYWFLKVSGVHSRVEIHHDSDATLAPTHIFIPWTRILVYTPWVHNYALNQ